MERLTTKNSMSQNVLRSPVICSRCGESDWSPLNEYGDRLTDQIAALEQKCERPAPTGDYIERAVALDRFSFEGGDAIPELNEDGDPNLVAIGDIKNTLRSIPSADAAAVQHGYWTWSPRYCKWICSECGGRETECESPFCKWCGARMDKKGEERT